VTEKAFKELPTFSEIKSGPLHPHPAALTQGAETFGAIFDSIRKNPELIPDAIQFYHACTSREDVLTAIRANCLRYLIDSSERIGKDVSLDIYPPRIRQIVRWIPRKRW